MLGGLPEEAHDVHVHLRAAATDDLDSPPHLLAQDLGRLSVGKFRAAASGRQHLGDVVVKAVDGAGGGGLVEELRAERIAAQLLVRGLCLRRVCTAPESVK